MTAPGLELPEELFCHRETPRELSIIVPLVVWIKGTVKYQLAQRCQ